jgi:ankyrin repeat protein
LSFRTYYDKRCDEHLDGTGHWLLESDLYTSWKSSKEPDLLWVRGKPGCGKSVLAAVTITDLKSEVGPMGPDTALAFAFCRREDESTQNTLTILGALTKQINELQSEHNPTLAAEYISQRGAPPTMRMVRSVMTSTLSKFSRVFIVIDALDECKNNRELAQELLGLMRDTLTSPLKVIVFSRPDFCLDEFFKPCKLIEPDRGPNTEDLEAYINSLFPDGSQATVNKKIREKCIAKADGMFLWVKLLEQSFQKSLTGKQKLNKIEDIPPGLESLYDRILRDIWEDEDTRSTAFLVLLWVTHAIRPLDRFEMLEAVVDYGGATRLEDTEELKLPNPEHLVTICANLVFVDKGGSFRLCHESVRGYLDKTGPDLPQPLAEYQGRRQTVQKRLADICLNYLRLNDFECGPAKSIGKLRSLVKRCHFLEYAAKFWGRHVSMDPSPQLQDLILKFVHSQPRRELSMQIALYDPADSSDLWKFPGTSNPLHILSIFGLTTIAETLADAVKLSQETDGSGAAPLKYALMKRHQEMTLWLIERVRTTDGLLLDLAQKIMAIHNAAALGWADVLKRIFSKDRALVNSKVDRMGPTPLVRACGTGQMEAAATLIEYGASVNLKDGTGDAPLIVATGYDHASVVSLLLEKDADPNCRDTQGNTPLHYAAENGNAAIAKALLARNANPLAALQSSDLETPFHIAARADAVDVIRALHQATPNLAVKGSDGSTPLHYAAWCGSAESAKVLLELGAPKNAVDDDGQSALFIAADNGALDTVKVLIEAGCDVRLAASNGKTAIHAAASTGKIAIMRCIMNHQPYDSWKTIVNQRTEAGETPIHAAVTGGSAKIVKLLLQVGADGTADGFLKSSPLHYAAHFGHKAIANFLLDHTKEANPRNENGDTPLHFAARTRNLDFIMRLFKDCSKFGLSIEVSAENASKNTAFMVALYNGSEDVAKFLMEKTSNTACNIDGNYPIHQAAWNGYDSIVQELLAGEGVTSGGYQARTPLLCAALCGHLTTLKLLVPLSGDILNVPDSAERTPLLAALQNRHMEAANYLLDIQADHNAIDDFGNSALHMAAGNGEAGMVQRLLKLGAKGDAVNRLGRTPFHQAVIADSIEVVDALIAANFNALDAPDYLGNFCSAYAASQGNLPMLQKLDTHGARYGSCNLLGQLAAYLAASGGHVDVLDFLEKHGEKLVLPDLQGVTSVMTAAREGYPETVKYLLRGQSHAINECNTWDGASSLIDAAKHTNPLTIGCLLAAGGDPYHRDAYGLNALDYAAQHRPSLREMHKAGHFHNPCNPISQQQTRFNTIRRCCEELLVPQEASVANCYRRITRVIVLAQALRLVQDYDASKICHMELCWRPKLSLVDPSFECEICRSSYFSGDKYVCKSCKSDTILCKKCYEEYKNAGKGEPEALNEIIGIEKEVRSVRECIPKNLTLVVVHRILNYFPVTRHWTSDALDAYETWEQKYNSSGNYAELPRPGQELLKMVKTMDLLTNKALRDGAVDPEDVKSYMNLNQKLENHHRRHRADKEIQCFICKNHEFFIVSSDEQEKAKSSGVDLDSDSGEMTAFYLQGLLDKYRHMPSTHVGTETLPKPSTAAKGTAKTEVSDRSITAEKAEKQERLPPRLLKRSTTSLWKSARQPQHKDSVNATMSRMTASAVLHPHIRPRGLPRRAQTLPVSMERAKDLRTETLHIEMKDTRAFSAVQALLDSKGDEEAPMLATPNSTQPTMKTTILVSFANDLDVKDDAAADSSTAATDAHLQDPPSSLGETALFIPLRDEPESIAEPPSDKNALALTESRETMATTLPSRHESSNDEEDGDVSNTAVQAIYVVTHAENASDEDRAVCQLALNATEAMVPGFIGDYFRFMLDERDQAEEEQEEEAYVDDDKD